MARAFCVLVLGCLVLGIAASGARADSKSGEIKFTGPKDSVTVSLGDKLKLEVDLKTIEVGPQAAVSVKGTVKNTTNARMYYSYNVAFLDKDKNLIGCQNFALQVEPNKDGAVGTFINLPRDQIAKIAHYSIAFHESDKPIGTK